MSRVQRTLKEHKAQCEAEDAAYAVENYLEGLVEHWSPEEIEYSIRLLEEQEFKRSEEEKIVQERLNRIEKRLQNLEDQSSSSEEEEEEEELRVRILELEAENENLKRKLQRNASLRPRKRQKKED